VALAQQTKDMRAVMVMLVPFLATVQGAAAVARGLLVRYHPAVLVALAVLASVTALQVRQLTTVAVAAVGVAEVRERVALVAAARGRLAVP
jgi:hypothetical protein